MSVDDRIREGLAMVDQKLSQELPRLDDAAAYDVVVQGARERSRRRSALAATGALAAAAAVVGVVQLGAGPDAPAPAQQPPSASPTGDPVRTIRSFHWGSLVGTWRSSDRVTLLDMADEVRDQGYPYDSSLSHLRRLVGDAFPAQGRTLRLELDQGQVKLFVGTRQLDHQTYQYENGRLVVSPYTSPGGRSRFGGTLTGDVLDLELLDTTVAEHVGAALEPRRIERGNASGVREAVWLTALYTTSTWERVG